MFENTLGRELVHFTTVVTQTPIPTAERWLASLLLKLVKIAARVPRHARATPFQRAAVAVNVGKQPC